MELIMNKRRIEKELVIENIYSLSDQGKKRKLIRTEQYYRPKQTYSNAYEE